MRIGCVLMAAGQASRYGSNKLLQPFLGKPLYRHALAALPLAALEGAVVVTGYEEVARAAQALGMRCVTNDRPEEGASLTVRLGVEALSHMDALMFAVADQPLLRRESVERLVSFSREHPDRIVALGHEGRRGNPVIFPRAYYEELKALTGNSGGAFVIRAHPEDVLCLETPDRRELWDVDTVEDMRLMRMEAGDFPSSR